VDKYKEGIECDPEHVLMVSTLYSNMAAAHMKQRKWAEAWDECNEALKIAPENQKALLRRAQCATELEKFQEAVNDYQTLTGLDENNREYQQMLRKAQKELKMSQRKNYYKILGVDKQAGESEIKRAFKKQAMKCHPDKVAPEDREAAELTFKDLNEAHEVLKNPQTRQRYDAGHDIEGCGGGGHDMGDMFQNGDVECAQQ